MVHQLYDAVPNFESAEQLVQIADMLTAAPEVASETLHLALGDQRLHPDTRAALRAFRDVLASHAALDPRAALQATARELTTAAALARLL